MPQNSTPLPAPGRAPGRRTGPPQHTTPPLWVRPLADWHQWLRAAGRPDTTIKVRVQCVRRFARYLPEDTGPRDVTQDQVIGWLADKDWAPETRKSQTNGLRAFFGWALDSGRVDADPLARLPRMALLRGRPRPVPDDMIQAAMDDADPRVRLMIQLGALAGLRRTEIAQVHTSDMSWDESGRCWWLAVTGKGRRERMVPLAPDLASALLALPRGYAFPNPDGGHLTADHVGRLLGRALPAGWSGHRLRHRFATAAYAADRDLLAVQQLLGHSRPEVTMIYTQVPSDAMRAAVAAAGRLRG